MLVANQNIEFGKSCLNASFFSRNTKNGTKLKCLEHLAWAAGTSETLCGTTLCKSDLVGVLTLYN